MIKNKDYRMIRYRGTMSGEDRMAYTSSARQIRERMQELYVYELYGFRLETKILAQIIYPHEQINCFATGIHDGLRRMVVVTDYRIIIVGRRLVGKPEIGIISRRDVTSHSMEKRWFTSSITVSTEESTYHFSAVSRRVVELFVWAMEQPLPPLDN
jgi:hypothetical protein